MNPPLDTLVTEIQINTEGDIVLSRRAVREYTIFLGFGVTDTARIVTAASELARNVFKYAGQGALYLRSLEAPGKIGIELKFVDSGPGIPDLDMAMTDGYSTGGGFGMGLPGAKKLMDEMEIQSVVGQGTTIVLKKWRNS